MRAEDASCPEPKMELFLRPQQFGEDSRSLGLRGITWVHSHYVFNYNYGYSYYYKPGRKPLIVF